MDESHTTWDERAILHVDMDAFFAAVEQLDHPEWRGRPVIVGGDPHGRGVVSAASYEARRFGVRSALPSARAAALCPDAVWARPRADRYSEVSLQVREILGEESQLVEPTSIDEAYLDITPGRYGFLDPVARARRIQTRVDALGISCSIGVATSKVVAKIASDREKPHGLTVVRPGTEVAFLAPLPVRLMPGIGAVTAARLRSLKILTLGELAALDAMTAADILGSGASTLLARARGHDPRPVVSHDEVKSVSNERTFPEDVHERIDVQRALTALARKVTERLRRKGLAGRTITLKVRYGDFTTRTARRTVTVATSDHRVVEGIVLELLTGLWSPGIGVRLLGVGVSGFEECREQLGLFDVDAGDDPSERETLSRSIEAVRDRFGPDAVHFGRSPTRTTDGGRTTGTDSTEDRRRT